MTRKLALIIGNSHYQDSALAKLKAPDADVHALASALRDSEIGGFDEVQAAVGCIGSCKNEIIRMTMPFGKRTFHR